MASRFQGVHKESTGYKMLAALGWREGEGLGAMKQGITEHVRVKKAEAAVKARDWTLGMVAYDRVLAALTEVTSHHAALGTDSGSEADERVVSPTEVAAAKAAAKAVRAARKAAKAAKAATESPAKAESARKHSSLEADGSAASSKRKRKKPPSAAQDVDAAQTEAPIAEAAAPAEPEAKRLRRTTHVGRFKRREAGKRVRHYSGDDLAAILGGQPKAAAAAAATEPVPSRAERAASPETPSASEPPKPTSSDLPQPEGGSPDAEAVSSGQQQGPEEQRWWHGNFVRAGRLGGLRKVKKDIARELECNWLSRAQGEGNGFLEEDQVAAWTAAQDGATKSKQGLGRSGQPRKVAGARWQGTRTKLGSDDDADDGASDGDDDARPSDDGEDEQEVVIRAPKSAAAAEPVLAAVAVAALDASVDRESGAAAAKTVKWKKISRKVLETQPGGAMKLKKLQSLAVTAAKLPAGLGLAEASAFVEQALRRSSMFVFTGKVVSLAKQ